MNSHDGLTRRSFVPRFVAGVSVLGVAPMLLRSAPGLAANDRLALAAVGVANKGGHNIENLKSENFVALCDVDENYLNAAAKAWPNARLYRDYRRMLDAEGSRIDGVVVSTADHVHAPATSAALALGKHVYCEKPLTHTVAEARAMAKLAAQKRVATQMGTQMHATANYRRVVELIRSGVIGRVTAVYNWRRTDHADGRFVPGEHKVPANLDWDLWLGPAKARPYSPGIHPNRWRRFWEYGTGSLGDMAAHVMDLPFWALNLRHPASVKCEGPEVHPDGTPKWTLAEYEFAARGELPALKLFWSDGGAHHDLVKNTMDHSGKPLAGWALGALFVGEKGMLAADYSRRELLPREKFADFTPPAPSIAESAGHWREWTQACKTGSPTTCNFDYSGALTETVLLAIVAYRSGKAFQWDAKNLKCSEPEAQRYLTKAYRKGFEVVGLG